MSGVHSIIPPSSAGIWGKPGGCTGWPLMAAQYPEPDDSPEALDGEASHELAAALISDYTRGPTSLRTVDKFIDKKASNGIIFTEEMYDAAKLYADDVGEVMHDQKIFGGPCFGNEHKIHAPQIHELSEGTLDQFIFDRSTNDLFLWDYKFGFLIVEAFENWQGINYLAGLINEFNIDGIEDQNIKVHLRIAQPRAFHRDGPIREWTFMLSDIRGHINNLCVNANKALSNFSEIHTGPHCAYCTARHACPAATKCGTQLFEVAMRPVPMELDPESLGVQLAIIKRAIKALEYLESGYDEQVKNLIRGGTLIPGWMVETGRGRERWAKPASEVIALGKLLKQDLAKPLEAITPNAARKLGIDNAVISAYSEKPSTGLKVVPDDGKKARQVFSS